MPPVARSCKSTRAIRWAAGSPVRAAALAIWRTTAASCGCSTPQSDACAKSIRARARLRLVSRQASRRHPRESSFWAISCTFTKRIQRRLRHLPWTEDGPVAYSCPQEFRFRFVQESWNKSEDSPCKVRFRVPVPPDTPYQKVETLQWGTQPTELVSDKFEQQVASFTGITIEPSGHHVLDYRVRVSASAVQYRLDDVPLAELDQIPEAVRSVYLGHDAHFDMDTPAVQQAAEQARKDSQGNAPSGVRSLIENIVAHVTGRLEYVMDDTWDSPAKVLPRGTGSCSEYSLVFTALARLNGVPARLGGRCSLARRLRGRTSNGSLSPLDGSVVSEGRLGPRRRDPHRLRPVSIPTTTSSCSAFPDTRSSSRGAASTTTSWDWATTSIACIKEANGNARRTWSSSRRLETRRIPLSRCRQHEQDTHEN